MPEQVRVYAVNACIFPDFFEQLFDKTRADRRAATEVKQGGYRKISLSVSVPRHILTGTL